jgi:hypothetical protein
MMFRHGLALALLAVGSLALASHGIVPVHTRASSDGRDCVGKADLSLPSRSSSRTSDPSHDFLVQRMSLFGSMKTGGDAPLMA